MTEVALPFSFHDMVHSLRSRGDDCVADLDRFFASQTRWLEDSLDLTLKELKETVPHQQIKYRRIRRAVRNRRPAPDLRTPSPLKDKVFTPRSLPAPVPFPRAEEEVQTEAEEGRAQQGRVGLMVRAFEQKAGQQAPAQKAAPPPPAVVREEEEEEEEEFEDEGYQTANEEEDEEEEMPRPAPGGISNTVEVPADEPEPEGEVQEAETEAPRTEKVREGSSEAEGRPPVVKSIQRAQEAKRQEEKRQEERKKKREMLAKLHKIREKEQQRKLTLTAPSKLSAGPAQLAAPPKTAPLKPRIQTSIGSSSGLESTDDKIKKAEERRKQLEEERMRKLMEKTGKKLPPGPGATAGAAPVEKKMPKLSGMVKPLFMRKASSAAAQDKPAPSSAPAPPPAPVAGRVSGAGPRLGTAVVLYPDVEEDYREEQPGVMAWAVPDRLLENLRRVNEAVDADVLFSTETTCDLEDIFQLNKPRYKRRTSSALWDAAALEC